MSRALRGAVPAAPMPTPTQERQRRRVSARASAKLLCGCVACARVPTPHSSLHPRAYSPALPRVARASAAKTAAAAAASDDEEEEEEEEEEAPDEEDEEEGGAGGGGADAPRSFDVLLTTYNIFDRTGATAAQDRALFRRFRWSYLICDEGHSLKKSDSQRFRALAGLHAQHRLLLSGTPIQHSVQELFSLLRFIQPALFTRKVEKIFAGEERRQRERAQGQGQAAKARRTLLEDLRKVLTPFILRRAKADVMPWTKSG